MDKTDSLHLSPAIVKRSVARLPGSRSAALSEFWTAMTPSPNEAIELERQYANGSKRSRGDEWTERNILALTAGELEVLFEMQPCFVYRLSLAAAQRLFKHSPEHLNHVHNAISRLLCDDVSAEEHPPLDGEPAKWKGLRERLTRREWLKRMMDSVATLTSAPMPTRSVDTSEVKALSPPQTAAKAEADASSQATSEAWFLPELRPGQFQLPHLATCGSLAQIGVRNAKRRQFGPDAPLHIVEFSGQSYGDTVVTYLGEELRTGDIEVWGQLLKLASPLPLGSRVTVSAKDLLTALGRGTGGPAYKAVRLEISRLQGARLAVRSSHEPMREQFRTMFPNDPLSKSTSRGPIEVNFQLLGPSTTDGRLWSIAVPREVRIAFGPQLSSWFSEREYGLLTRRREGDTVKRLYLLYRSHAKPWPFTVQELRRYIGSTMGRDSDLRASLDMAHDRLTKAGLITAWRYGQSNRRRNAPDRVYEVDYRD